MTMAGTARQKPGRYGRFGGQFVAPVLLPVLDRLETAFYEAWGDPVFRRTFEDLLERFVGRPTPIFETVTLASVNGGARIILKRDDLTFDGGNYANSALGQCLLAVRMGLGAVVADTGSGQNGVAAAAVAARLGLACTIYMGRGDAARHASTIKKMRAFGADLRIVDDADGTLSAATSAAIRHWMGSSTTTAYLAGAPIGAHPYPAMVGAFQSVIGRETRLQLLEAGVLPRAIVSAVGGGSSTIGIFSAFVGDRQIRLVAVEAGGAAGDGDPHSARLGRGRPGIFHGAETLVLADEYGQIQPTASIAPGLAYPGSAPEIADLVARGRVETVAIDDNEAREAVLRLASREGILVSLEAGHAVAAAERIAAGHDRNDAVVVMVPSAGDKDLDIIWPGE